MQRQKYTGKHDSNRIQAQKAGYDITPKDHETAENKSDEFHESHGLTMAEARMRGESNNEAIMSSKGAQPTHRSREH